METNACKVSIIMPVYNKEKYVGRAIESVLKQTFLDWELIIIDDGSTDHSLDICRQYKDSRIKVFHTENCGVSHARNCGLSKAKGEWIWFIDSDDYSDTEFLHNIFNNDENKSEIIVGSFNKVNRSNSKKHIEISETGKVTGIEFPELFMKYQYSNGYWGYLWNKLIRLDLIQRMHAQFKDGLTLAEDLQFMVQLYPDVTSVKCVPYTAMNYQDDAENSSRDKVVDYDSQLRIQMEIYDWIVRKGNCMQYENFLRKVISEYAAFIVFYAYEDKQDYIGKAVQLIHDSDVSELLSEKNVDHTMKPIVHCLIRKDTSGIKRYLCLRDFSRNIYRMIKGKRKNI